jgi:hypothetical protein
VELPGDMPGTSISIATAAIAGRPIASVSLVGPQWASTHVTADAYPPNPTSLLASQQVLIDFISPYFFFLIILFKFCVVNFRHIDSSFK